MGEQKSEDDGPEGDAFDEGGGDQHVGADAAGGFGLTGDAFAGLPTDLTDAAAGADGGQSKSDDRAADPDALSGSAAHLRQNVQSFPAS